MKNLSVLSCYVADEAMTELQEWLCTRTRGLGLEGDRGDERALLGEYIKLDISQGL
jgi:hypothetical protein